MCIMVERGGQEIGRSTRGHGCWFNNWPRAECTAFKQRAGGRPAGHEESHLGLKFLFLCLTAAAVRTLSIKPRSGCDSPSILSIRNCERVTGCHSMVVKSAKRSQLVGEEKRAKRKRDLFLVLFCILCDGRVVLYTAKTLP